MPQTAPLRQPPPAPETPAERRDRQAAQLRRLADLNMQAAEVAAEQVLSREPRSPEAPNPNLDLTRATRAVAYVIAAENRIFSGEPAPHAHAYTRAAADPRRPLLREALHQFIASEPDRAARAQLRRMIDERIDEELGADPDHETRTSEILATVADEFGIEIDPAQLSDELLGLKPPPRPANDGSYAARPALWSPTYVPDPADTT